MYPHAEVGSLLPMRLCIVMRLKRRANPTMRGQPPKRVCADVGGVAGVVLAGLSA